ncbi:WD repeat-containing protein 76-like [Watersipora subatra]|uniref:WD repeat-containing protein 76-like n=1 Tax=Watersipora subatra TaxID=2589382 RepID=UPI00355C88A4
MDSGDKPNTTRPNCNKMPICTRKRCFDLSSAGADDDKSWFEKRREDNLKANAAFLSSLQIKEAKSSLLSSHTRKESKPKKPTTTRGIKVPSETKEYLIQPRKSLRLRSRTCLNDSAGSIPDDPLVKLFAGTNRHTSSILETDNAGENDAQLAQLREANISWADCFTNSATGDSAALVSKFQEFVTSGKSKIVKDNGLKNFVQTCKRMSISERSVAKVAPKRIFSLAIHPTSQRAPLLAVGDKWGHVAFWNVIPGCEEEAADAGVCLFKPHVRPVNCSLFSSYNHHILHTASYDGTVRRCDANKQSFSLAYLSEDEVRHMYMSEVDGHVISVASADGSVTYIDERSDAPSVYDLDAERLKCISHHPVQRQYFITGSVKGKVQLWDDRYINNKKTRPLVTLPSRKGVLSAYFSPLTGQRILTCTADDRVSVYDSSELTRVESISSFYHNNKTGRWLSNFRASWHPAREDCFLIGALKQPREIEMFDCNGNLLHSFCDNNEVLQSITSLNVFHPTLPVLAGANSSGKVYVFMDSSVVTGQ